MRWFGLFLLILNAAVFVAQQRTAPGSDNSEATRVATLQRLQEVSADPVLAINPAPAASTCLVFGPFADPDAARRALPMPMVIKRESVEVDADYWVYSGPFASLGEASAKSSWLTARRVDNFVIPRGRLSNAVSLGVFTSKARADRQAEKMRELGLTVAVDKRPRMADRYWLVLSGELVSAFGEASSVALKLLEDKDKSLAKKSCDLIASYQDFD